jgi:hypothetical protein
MSADKLTDFSSRHQIAAELCSHCNNVDCACIAVAQIASGAQTCAMQKSWIAKLTYLCRDTVNEIGDNLQLK